LYPLDSGYKAIIAILPANQATATINTLYCLGWDNWGRLRRRRWLWCGSLRSKVERYYLIAGTATLGH
jgi:hypothetical protein